MSEICNPLSASNIEDFTKTAIDSTSLSDQRFVLVLKESSNTYSNFILPSDEKKSNFVTYAAKNPKSTNDENSWVDYYSNPNAQKGNFSYALKKKRPQPTTFEEDEANLLSDLSEITINRNIMMIGCRRTGKHALIRSVFGEESKEDIALPNQIMDLIVKTEKQDNIKTNYHLWLKMLDDHKFDNIIRLYYKRMKMFVFVYSVYDEKTFEELDEVLQSILKDIPKETFSGILLGNRTIMNDMECERQVSYANGLALKEKYNLKLFFETDYNDECLKEQITSVLNF